MADGSEFRIGNGAEQVVTVDFMLLTHNRVKQLVTKFDIPLTITSCTVIYRNRNGDCETSFLILIHSLQPFYQSAPYNFALYPWNLVNREGGGWDSCISEPL